MDEEGLMSLMIRFQRYEDHVAGLFACAEIDEQEAESVLELAKAKHLVAGWTGSSSDRVAIGKAQAALDEDVQDAQDAHLQAKARRKLLGVMVNTMSSGAQVCSRELTRRTGGRPDLHRGERYNR